MAMASRNNNAFDPDLYLSADQQDLLLTALNSNKVAVSNGKRSYPSLDSVSNKPTASRSSSNSQQYQHFNESNINNNSLFHSPLEEAPGSGSVGNIGTDESPFLDLDDGNFDWENNAEQMFGTLPGSSGNDEDGDLHDKRKASDDDQDDDEGGGKRREGDDKTSKKPGRKPLTSEPTSKRKAQNRAAQRAFRERKERHLKELENKVDDLEKASESANHENGLLRAQVDRLQTELKDYRKRLSLNGNAVSRSPPLSSVSTNQPRSQFDINNNFQFEFPKFGGSSTGHSETNMRTTPSLHANGRSQGSPAYIPGVLRQNSSLESPKTLSTARTSFSDTNVRNRDSIDFNRHSMDELSGLFSPSILESASRSGSADYMSYPLRNTVADEGKIGGIDGMNSFGNPPPMTSGSSVCTTSSPESSTSHNGLNSSCGTTPEPTADSPHYHKVSEGNLDTVDEGNEGRRDSEYGDAFNKEFSAAYGNTSDPISASFSQNNTTSFVKTPNNEFQGIDWLAQQNGGAFDPVLFGDYRDPQDNIMGGDFGGFFNDALPIPDFGSPLNTMRAPTPGRKRDLMQEIEDSQGEKEPDVVREEKSRHLLTCNMLWNRVQQSQKVKSGEADMDDLCSQLKSKAKCSGTGAMIEKKDVDAILGPAAKGLKS